MLLGWALNFLSSLAVGGLVFAFRFVLTELTASMVSAVFTEILQTSMQAKVEESALWLLL